MLIELTIILSTYGSLRFFDKKKSNIKGKKDPPLSQQLIKPDENLQFLAKKSAKKELNISYMALGVSLIQPIFFPSLFLLNTILITRSSYSYFKNAEQSIRNKKLSNDILGASSILFASISGQYLAAALGNIIYHIGTNFIQKTRDQSQKAIVNIFDQQDKSVWVLRNTVEIEISLEDVLINDIVVLNSGEMIPVDGLITRGCARLDEHILTGESQMVEKKLGDSVFASTLLISGTLHVKVTKAGNNTVVSKIENILNDSSEFKTELQLKGEKWADKTVPYLLGAAGLTALTVGFIPATAVLAAQFGYQLRLIIPLSTLEHLTETREFGILVKDGRSLECLVDVDTILFDKTGTLTEEKPQVNQVITWGEYNEEEILRFAATAEVKLKHPIAKAILNAYAIYETELDEVDEVDESHYEIGFGTTVKIKQQTIRVGSLRFMQNEGLNWEPKQYQQLESIYEQGHSIVFIGVNTNIIGAIEIKPTIRPEIPKLIQELKQCGIKNLMIVSGDHEIPTRQLAKKLGIEYIAEVLPENKAKIVTEQQKLGRKVCFIGDGINDTIAMKQADVSISLEGASAIATDTADIILMNGNLSALYKLFDISFSLDKTMKKSGILVIIPAGLILFSSLFLQIGLLTAVMIKNGFLSANTWYVLRKPKGSSRDL